MLTGFILTVTFDSNCLSQAETPKKKEEWMSVLLNSKEGALNQEFQDSSKTPAKNELQTTLVSHIRSLPGNDKCCDCNSDNG